jgi:hypothetical protein
MEYPSGYQSQVLGNKNTLFPLAPETLKKAARLAMNSRFFDYIADVAVPEHITQPTVPQFRRRSLIHRVPRDGKESRPSRL